MRNGSNDRNGSGKTERRVPIRRGSENVFADLNLPNPDLLRAKAQIVQRIRAVIAQRRLTQAAAAAALGIDQPKVSALIRGRVEGYSIERLFRFLSALGQRVEIAIRPARSAARSRTVVVK